MKRTKRLPTVRDVKARVVAVGEPRELLTTRTMAGYLLPERGTNEMSRRLLVINVVLGLLCLAFAVGIVRSLLVKRPLPAASAARTAVAPVPAVIPAQGVPGPETYAALVAQNLFNPGRSETATATAVAVVKPILHGIVIEGSKSRAFLEDPSLKRVTGYSVGDPMAGGKLQTIAHDRVVIARPEGLVEVLLQDPAKPRPAPPAPAAPVVAGAASQPVLGQLGPSPPPGQFVPVQVAPGQVVRPPAGVAPGRVVTPAYEQVLGQMIPSDAPANQTPTIPSRSRRRAAAPGQPANE
jgi:hypothetical protein